MKALGFFFRRRGAGKFRGEESGAVLAEALLAIPFVTLFAVGILEFGNIFWQKQQIETGLRDAARYMARCRPTTPTYTANCNVTTAKTIAYYGTQSPALGAKLRVPGWGPDLADITVGAADANGDFTVSTAHVYQSSPLFSWLGIDVITLHSAQQERYMGW
jgi:Flp pilus assembly protein TadG